jgi:hypothetical protein
MRCDDGDGETPTGWPYDRWEMCWGRHTCHMGVVKALKALAEIPPERRSPAVQRTLDDGAEFMLRHHVHKRSHDLAKTSKPGWRRLSFPLMWQTDVLEILGILTNLGRAGDERAREARASAGTPGSLDARNTFNGRFVVDIETGAASQPRVTLQAPQRGPVERRYCPVGAGRQRVPAGAQGVTQLPASTDPRAPNQPQAPQQAPARHHHLVVEHEGR